MRKLRLLTICLGMIGLGMLALPLPALAAADLDQAFHILAGKRLVDLSHAFDGNSPVWQGFGQARMMPMADPKTRRPYTIAGMAFAPPGTSWSAYTEPMSIPRRISP